MNPHFGYSRCRSPRPWVMVAVLGGLALGSLAADDKVVPKVPLGKETTYVTGPLDKDGYIDYEAALNDRLSKGITPEKNANVLIWKALGPTPVGTTRMPADYFKRLGMEEPPNNGSYFVDYGVFSREHFKVAANEKEFEGLLNQLSRATKRPWTVADDPRMAAWLQANEKALALVIEATRRPAYYNPLVTQQQTDAPRSLYGALLPSPQECRSLARALAARAMLRTGEGKYDDAWQDLLACHRLARLLGSGGTIIEALVGIAIERIAGEADLAFLQCAKHSSKQAEQHLKELKGLKPWALLADKIDLSERFSYLDTLQLARRGGISALEAFATGKPKKPTPAELQLSATMDWEPALRTGNKWYDRMVSVLRVKDRSEREKAFDLFDQDIMALRAKATTVAQDFAAKSAQGISPDKNSFMQSVGDIFASSLMPAIRKIQVAYDLAEQAQRNLHVTFALAGYHADHNRYPAKLDELAPKYLATIPDDLYSGKPLIYRPSEKGYLLYSVGANGKDDGGRGTDDDPPGDDLSVRMPTSDSKAAQPPTTQPPIEEEDPKAKPPRKPIPVEEEDPKKPTKPLRPIPVEEGSATKRPAERDTVPTELAREATNPALDRRVRTLYQVVAYPHDRVIGVDGTVRLVWPITHFLGAGSTYSGPVVIRQYEGNKLDGKLLVPWKAAPRELKAVVPYEELALNAVADFEKATAPSEGDSKNALPAMERWKVIERALAVVERFHSDPQNRDQPKVNRGWKALGERLQKELLSARLEQLQLCERAGDWEAAYALALRLKPLYSAVGTHEQFAAILVKLVEAPLKARQYKVVHQRLNILDADFPNTSAAKPIREGLREQAKALFDSAKTEQDRVKSAQMIAEANRIWPTLPGLREAERRLSNEYPILNVGVHSLPEMFSPATAVTDADRYAVELIFESLIKAEPEADGTMRCVPGLAATLPRVIPQGRVFHLDPEARWSNEKRVTEADVRQTIRLLRSANPPWIGYCPEWASLIGDSAMRTGNPNDVIVALRQGFLDPLSLMQFKVLPAASLDRPLANPADADFARHPVGSGPFQLRAAQPGSVVFVANPQYQRASRPGLPHIQEVHFVQSQNPASDFSDGRLQLLIDPPPATLQKLRSLDAVSIQALRNRRIYFLAVNHRFAPLQNADFRKALAHAIDRKAILDAAFREEGAKDPPHRPLKGPYPPDSWAGKASDSISDLFQPDLAKQQAESVRLTPLSLKYPTDDPRVAEACRLIQEQARQNAGITLELEPRTRRQFREEVEVQHHFQLAYCSYDYAGENYWLWPLFNTDPQALEPGGHNYMGYRNDGEMESAFQDAMLHRDFKTVKDRTGNIHHQIVTKMPVIPLWQIDTILAVHRDLHPVHVDPLRLFNEVEKWQLKAR